MYLSKIITFIDSEVRIEKLRKIFVYIFCAETVGCGSLCLLPIWGRVGSQLMDEDGRRKVGTPHKTQTTTRGICSVFVQAAATVPSSHVATENVSIWAR